MKKNGIAGIKLTDASWDAGKWAVSEDFRKYLAILDFASDLSPLCFFLLSVIIKN